MAGVNFLEKLLLKLKTGNARSIHLNALPGNMARLDLYDLIQLDHSLHLKFLRQLLTRSSFRFEISVDLQVLETAGPEEATAIRHIIKRLNTLYYQQVDEWQEHGIRTFAFGYPLLIRRDPLQPRKIIKAPLLLWYVDLEKDLHRNNTWKISRTEEHPVIFNEVLRSHLETNERISMEDIAALPEEGLVDEAFVIGLCERMLDKLGTKATEIDREVKVLPGTNRETIEKHTGDLPWIRWSGIFGLYKTQKQSIISDLERFIGQPDMLKTAAASEGENVDSIYPAVSVDPSQEGILRQLRSEDQLIIQGPPGTGKSQSLTALISDALFHGKTCLVVCEKKTALDVIHEHLRAAGLADLCLLIEDIHRDRKPVVDRVRDQLDRREEPPAAFRRHDFEALCHRYDKHADRSQASLTALNNPCFGDDTISELMVKVESAKAADGFRLLKLSAGDLSMPPTYDDWTSASAAVAQAAGLFTPDCEALERIQDRYFETGAGAAASWFDALRQRIGTMHSILEALHRHAPKDALWLTDRRRRIDWILAAGGVFSARWKNLRDDRRIVRQCYASLLHEREALPLFEYALPHPDSIHSPEDIEAPLQSLLDFEEAIVAREDQWNAYHGWRANLLEKEPWLRTVLEALAKQVPPNRWQPAFDHWYKSAFIADYLKCASLEPDLTRNLQELEQVDQQRREAVPGAILYKWQERQKAFLKKQTLTHVRHLYNYRSNKSYGKRNSLRRMVHQNPELFKTVFPVLMVNPVVCSSILPLEQGLYDTVLFDEASQLRIEDTFPALYRGTQRIISGDKHQMPPSSWFQSNMVVVGDELPEGQDDDENSGEDELQTAEDDFLASSNSLLEYGTDSAYVAQYLDFHYRSRHPDLIAFSNAAFYGGRLVPMPASVDGPAYEFHALDGIYERNRTNPAEAAALVDHLYRTMARHEGPYPSVGIATFNLNQRDLIWEMLSARTYDDPASAAVLDALLEAGLFVKNLEHIQGDERDMLYLSTTFGPAADGSFRQQFGPVTRENGYKLLNVLITRARKKVVLFCSVPNAARSDWAAKVAERGNEGNGIFYAYLQFAEAMAAGDHSRSQAILDTVARQCSERHFRHELARMPPFHQKVYMELQDRFGTDMVRHNLPFGGFLLDIAAVREGKPVLALLSNVSGSQHPLSSRMLLFKKQMLESRGVTVEYLDVLAWYKAPDAWLKSVATTVADHLDPENQGLIFRQ